MRKIPWYRKLSTHILAFFFLLFCSSLLPLISIGNKFFSKLENEIHSLSSKNIKKTKEAVFTRLKKNAEIIIQLFTKIVVHKTRRFLRENEKAGNIKSADELIEFCLNSKDFQNATFHKFADKNGYTTAGILSGDRLICISHENKKLIGKNLFEVIKNLSPEDRKKQKTETFIQHWMLRHSGGIYFEQTGSFRPKNVPTHLTKKYAYQWWDKFNGIDLVIETTVYLGDFKAENDELEKMHDATQELINKKITQSAEKFSKLIIFFNISCIIIGTLCILFFGQLEIRSPLNKILAGLEKFGQGDFSEKIETHSNREFSLIEDIANQMAANLSENMEKLKDLNENLEDKVKARTQQLEDEKEKVSSRTKELEEEQEKSEKLLQNILPVKIAKMLKDKVEHSFVEDFAQVSIIFSDFKDFTRTSESVTPEKLINELNEIFANFDGFCEENNIEKIKTIGDAYMAVGGLPERTHSHPVDAIKMAIAMRDYIEKRLQNPKKIPLKIRIGIHSGPVIAGIIGKSKFTYDLWGDSVNIASRLESASEPGKINISQETYKLVKDIFACTYRGEIEIKGKDKIKMYFVDGYLKEPNGDNTSC
ncbi:adenylate/guanylate cyclase domain-containing protein [Candidatus Riflebacteria bacterium]